MRNARGAACAALISVSKLLCAPSAGCIPSASRGRANAQSRLVRSRHSVAAARRRRRRARAGTDREPLDQGSRRTGRADARGERVDHEPRAASRHRGRHRRRRRVPGAGTHAGHLRHQGDASGIPDLHPRGRHPPAGTDDQHRRVHEGRRAQRGDHGQGRVADRRHAHGRVEDQHRQPAARVHPRGQGHLEHSRIQGAGRRRRDAGRRRQPGRTAAVDVGARHAERPEHADAQRRQRE